MRGDRPGARRGRGDGEEPAGAGARGVARGAHRLGGERFMRCRRSVRTCRPTATGTFRPKPRARSRCISARARRAGRASATPAVRSGAAGAAAPGLRRVDRVARPHPPGGGEPRARAGPPVPAGLGARPLILPSLVPAVLVLLVVMSVVLSLDREADRLPAVYVRNPGQLLEPAGAPVGHGGQPALPLLRVEPAPHAAGRPARVPGARGDGPAQLLRGDGGRRATAASPR